MSAQGPGVAFGEATDSFEQTAGRDSFELSHTDAVPETLVVGVDGVTTTAGWSYDSGLNAVVFDAA